MKTISAVLAVWAVLIGAESGAVEDNPGRIIEEDWARQEAVQKSDPGSIPAISEAIKRGMALAENIRKAGKPAEAGACVNELLQCEEALKKLSGSGKSAEQGVDGWYLVRASVCGAGPALDSGRVRGKDYTLPVAPKLQSTGQPFIVRTLSFDENAVQYRFSGLSKDARYRLRSIYGVDRVRNMRLEIDGTKITDITVPDAAAVELTNDIPAGLTSDGAIDISVVNVSNCNAVVSVLELWSTEKETDATESARVATCAVCVKPVIDRDLYHRVRYAVRKLMFSHPSLDFDELLFVKRNWPWMGHQCGHRVGENQIPGADLCILKGLSPAGKVRGLLPEEMTSTVGIGRPDLSFDAKRIVFPLAKPRVPPTKFPVGAGHDLYDPKNPADSSPYRGGACLMYDIYEIGVDGSGFRQVINEPGAEDTEPCYLPDGRIVFTSSRDGRLVQCGDWALVFGMFTVNPDGSDVRSFTQPQDSEFYPAVLDDGRILFTRWDYVMKAYNVIQQLWSVNPDGTKTQLAYGDWYSFSRGPIALFEARQIPGTSKVVATGSAHHNTGAGPIMVVDLNQNRGGPSGFRNITPEVGYPECERAATWDERTDKSVPDSPLISHGAPNATGWYASPWPLAENLFLCCYTFENVDSRAKAWGIYLIDDNGNKELVHRTPGFSCYSPIPLKSRKKPIIIPPIPVPKEPEAAGRLFVQDVHIGLHGVPSNTVKWLRVCETYPKMRHTNPHRCDVGVASGYDMRGVLGTVPVEADGSAFFEVPQGKMIFLEALDKDHLEVKRMRNYINLQPGEQQSCIGCHEVPGTANPSGARPVAAMKAPAKIIPPPWGAGPMNFNKIVQPVLDRNCVSCHDGDAVKKNPFSLKGGTMVTAPHAGDADEGPQHTVSTSFLALLKHVKYVKVTGYAGRKLPLDPYEVGSAVSPLMQMLKKGHNDVKLPDADWQAFAAWIDCNAPYFGSYDDDMLQK